MSDTPTWPSPQPAPADLPPAPAAKKSHRKRNILLGAGAVVVLLAIAGGSGSSTSSDGDDTTVTTSGSSYDAPPSSKSGVTLANFNRIESGMSYSEVVSILGKSGEELSRVDIAGTPATVMYQWNGRGLGNMNAMFQGGELVSKAQFGLK